MIANQIIGPRIRGYHPDECICRRPACHAGATDDELAPPPLVQLGQSRTTRHPCRQWACQRGVAGTFKNVSSRFSRVVIFIVALPLDEILAVFSLGSNLTHDKGVARHLRLFLDCLFFSPKQFQGNLQ